MNKTKITLFFLVFLNSIFGQVTSIKWMYNCNCSKQLYYEFEKLDSSIFLIEEEVNRKHNQSYGGPSITLETVKEYYNRSFLLECQDEIIEQVNCILNEYPSGINPRCLYLISHLVLNITDERYTTFLELVLDNIEKGNFSCTYQVDCKDIFLSLFMPDDGAIRIKEKYLIRNFKKKSFQKLLNKIYTSKNLNSNTKSVIEEQMDFLTSTRKK